MVQRTLFSKFSVHLSDAYYCDSCHNSEYLFGCIGLKRSKYCVLNKQYSKEEYEALVPRIIEHMKKAGEWAYRFLGALRINVIWIAW